MDLEISPVERSVRADRQREGEPAGSRLGQLCAARRTSLRSARRTQGDARNCARGRRCSAPAWSAERGRRPRLFPMVPDYSRVPRRRILRHRDALQFDVEPSLHGLGIDEERGGPTPGSQQQAATGHGLIVETQHPAIASRVDDMRAVEARRADVRSRPGAGSAESRAQRVGTVLDHDQVVPIGDVADPVPIGQSCRSGRDHHRPCPAADHGLDRAFVDIIGSGAHVDKCGDEPVANDRRNRRGEGECGVMTSLPRGRSSSSTAR